MKRSILIGIWLLIWALMPLALIRMLWTIITNPSRALKQAVAFDRTGNALLNGSDLECISTRANRARLEGRRWGCVLCYLLDKLDKDHCINSKN